MSNFFEMKCPKCGDEDHIDIVATLWVRVTNEGTDADASGDSDHEYTPRDAAGYSVCRYNRPSRIS